MDSKQIEEFLSTICRFTLMILAFGNIPNFHEEFLAFCINTLGDSADILALQERLQEKFISKLRNKLCNRLYYFMCQHHYDYDNGINTCDNEADCMSREHKLWYEAFEDLKDEIIIKINKKYVDIAWALDNFTNFKTELSNYMNVFAKTRQIDITSPLCLEYFEKIKNNIQIMMNEYIEHEKGYHDYLCCDDGYAFGSKQYFVCNCIPKQSEIEKKWIENLHICIDQYNAYSAFYADRTYDFEEEEISFKVILQRDFSKKLKKKKNHRKSKL